LIVVSVPNRRGKPKRRHFVDALLALKQLFWSFDRYNSKKHYSPKYLGCSTKAAYPFHSSAKRKKYPIGGRSLGMQPVQEFDESPTKAAYPFHSSAKRKKYPIGGRSLGMQPVQEFDESPQSVRPRHSTFSSDKREIRWKQSTGVAAIDAANDLLCWRVMKDPAETIINDQMVKK
jgi:hypothetical protein